MGAKNPAKIVPIILAAGGPGGLPFPKPLAAFGEKLAIEIALENCRGLERPVVVLGAEAARVRRAVPSGARVVVNRRWRTGQLSSLLAGLARVPRNAAFLVYPVDHPLLTARVIRRLVAAFQNRSRRKAIVLPRFGDQTGHPVIFSAQVRQELAKAHTAKEVAYRDPQRIRFVPVNTPAIHQDFNNLASYCRCLGEYLLRERRTH